MRWLAAALFTLALAQTGVQAQQQFVLNGVPVAGLDTELVPGTAYAPAEPYARALGAEYRFDARAGVLLAFGGRLLTLQVDVPARAGTAGALTVDGRAQASPGAVRVAGTVYLPVKSVTAALGGHTAYLAEARTVAVVFPRPRLLAAEPPGVWGSFERFILHFSAPVGLERFFEPSLNVVRFRFPRAELGSERLAQQRFPPGSRFSAAAFIPGGGFLDLYLTLREGADTSVFSEPFGEGERVVIDIFNVARRTGPRTPAVVLQADANAAAFAKRLKDVLEARGVRVLTTGAAAPEGFTAPFLLALREAPVTAGRFSVYYLAGADAPTLAAPVRSAAAGVVSEAGRARVAQLTPDLERGERLARALAGALTRHTPLTLASLMGAPLLELSGAAGRGVMLELSPADLAGGNLAAPLGAAVTDLLRGR